MSNRSGALPTNWIFFQMASRDAVDAYNLILEPVDGVKITYNHLDSAKNCIRINRELRRRGIDFQISDVFCKTGTTILMRLMIIPIFIQMHQLAKALNFLSADYNSRN